MNEMNNKELVSAVITTHSRLEYLKRAIDSVFSQTYPNIECIVVSDNSIDGTNEYCESRKDITFINIKPEESRGGNYARNLGIKIAKGKYVAFLDDDDAWLPTKIEKQVNLLEEKKCECVYCLRKYELVKDGEIINHTIEGTRHKIEGDISKKIFRHSFTSTSCLLATKSILEKVGGFDEDLCKLQEYELLIRISQRTGIHYYHDEPLVLYTIIQGDKTRISNDPKRLPIAKKYIEKKHEDLLKGAGLLNRLLHNDWMLNALYHSAVKSKDRLSISKYGLYHFISQLIKNIGYILNK